MYNSASLQKCRKMLKVCNCWDICSERDPTKFDLLAEYRCFSVLVLTRKILRLMIKWPNSMVYSCCKSMNEPGSDSRIFRGLSKWPSKSSVIYLWKFAYLCRYKIQNVHVMNGS